MCEILGMMVDKLEVIVAVAFVFGLLVEWFPKLKEWEAYKKALLGAGISIVVPVGAFLIGSVQGCWPLIWDSALPFVIAGLAAAVASLGGEKAVESKRSYSARAK